MEQILAPLGPKMRLSIALSTGLLASALGLLALSKMVSGPWHFAVFSGLVAAIATNLAFIVWPAKPPVGMANFIEKWKKAKGRSSKTLVGKFIWNTGRGCIAAFVISALMDATVGISGFAKLAFIIGFSISFGFFGIRAAVWSGVVVLVCAHRLALNGLGIDLTEAEARNLLIQHWVGGASISWWWAIAFVAVAPAWILLSGLSIKIGNQISEDMAERREVAFAKSKIEARRARLRGRTTETGEDELALAIKAREAAQAKVEAAATGANGALPQELIGKYGSSALLTTLEKGVSELTGVAKLEYENNEATLLRYIGHAQSIQEATSNGVDVNTVARHSFDRVVQALSDTQLEILKAGVLPGSTNLLEYYKSLCSGEAKLMAGGDGEIVTSQAIPPDVLDSQNPELNDTEYETEGFDRTDAPLLREVSYMDDDKDDLFSDVLDRVRVPSSSGAAAQVSQSTPAAVTPEQDALVHRRVNQALDGLEPMVAGGTDKHSAGSDQDLHAGIESDMKLPTTTSKYYSLDEVKGVNTAEDWLGDAGIIAAKTIAPDATDKGVSSEGDAGDRSAVDDTADNGTANDDSDAGDGPAADDSVENVTASEGGDAADGPAADDSAENVTPNDDGDAADGPAADDSAENVTPCDIDRVGLSAPTADELRAAAATILGGEYERDFVLSTKAYFKTLQEAELALGANIPTFVKRFSNYRAKVLGANLECKLADEFEARDLEAVRLSLAALKTSAWLPKEGLIEEVSQWVEECDSKHAADVQKALDEEALEAEAEAERIAAAEEKQRIADETAREEAAEKIRQDEINEANERAAAEEKAAAEELALNEKRQHDELVEKRYATGMLIVLGRLSDDLLDASADLFPSLDVFAETLRVAPEEVADTFEIFTSKLLARHKLVELRNAWQNEDLTLVQALIKDPSVFNKCEGYEDILDGASSWAHAEVMKQRVLGLEEKFTNQMAGPSEDAQRLFLRRRNKTSEQQAYLIDVLLPNAMKISKQFKTLIDLMNGEVGQGTIDDYEKSQLEVVNHCAEIVANADQCREYAVAFLPNELREPGVDVWDMIVDLARSKNAELSVPEIDEIAEVEPLENLGSGDEKVSETQNSSSTRLQLSNVVIPSTKKMTVEEVQALEPVSHLKGTIVPHHNPLDYYERSYVRACSGLIGEGVDHRDVLTSDGMMGFSFFLEDKNGEPQGRLLFYTMLDKQALWYHHSSRKIYVMDIEAGNKLRAQAATEISSKLTMFGEESSDPRNKVRGILIISPSISPDGITSFQPFVDEFKKFPILFRNKVLPEKELSAFVEKILAH